MDNVPNFPILPRANSLEACERKINLKIKNTEKMYFFSNPLCVCIFLQLFFVFYPLDADQMFSLLPSRSREFAPISQWKCTSVTHALP